MKKVCTRLALAVSILVTLSSLARGADVSFSAAASLKDVMNEVADLFAKKNPQVRLLRNYGASGALAKQIENGVPADIYIPASLEWMEYLTSRKIVAIATVGTFARNTLVFVGSSGRAVASMQDLLALNRIAIGSPKSVPAGQYAREALTKAGLLRRLEPKLVMGRDVRECLMYVEREEVDGAFVYRSDALLVKRAKLLFPVPQNLYSPVTYPMALTETGVRNRDAERFFRFLQSDETRRVLSRHGFLH